MTTVSGDQRAGCLIGFHAQCSIEPPRYVIWLSKANHTLRVGLASRFTVHFLSEGDHDLAEVLVAPPATTSTSSTAVTGMRAPTASPCSTESPTG